MSCISFSILRFLKVIYFSRIVQCVKCKISNLTFAHHSQHTTLGQASIFCPFIEFGSNCDFFFQFLPYFKVEIRIFFAPKIRNIRDVWIFTPKIINFWNFDFLHIWIFEQKKRKKKIITYFEIIFMPKFFLEILWARKTSKMSHFSTLKVAPLLRCTKNQWVISKRNSKTHPTAIYSCGFLVPKFLRAACKVLNNAKPKLFLIERQNYSFALF